MLDRSMPEPALFGPFFVLPAVQLFMWSEEEGSLLFSLVFDDSELFFDPRYL